VEKLSQKVVAGRAGPHAQTQLCSSRVANLLTITRINYGVTGSVRVRVSISIKLFVLHFIDIYWLDGATVVYTDPEIALRDRSMVTRSTDACANDRSVDSVARSIDRAIPSLVHSKMSLHI